RGTHGRTWTVRRRSDSRAVGMLQAAFSDEGRAAEIAWAVGVPWQGQGIASEAAGAVVGWLAPHKVSFIPAHIPPDHHASAKVATRAGLRPTGEYRDHEGIREQLWRRQVQGSPSAIEGSPPSESHPSPKEGSMPTADGDPVRERLAGYAAPFSTRRAPYAPRPSSKRSRARGATVASPASTPPMARSQCPRTASRQLRFWTASTAIRR